MANTSGTPELEAREAEAEEARARLARTFDTLTSPETQQAVKAEMVGHLEGYKDELLRMAEKYKDELLHRADDYKGELLTRAEQYKGEIMERAEQYKGEFLTRADCYKDEFLERADSYKNELMERARDSGREALHSIADDLKQRALNNPLAVAMIGAGVGWRLYKHPPITTLLVGTGMVLLMRTPGSSAQSDHRAYRDPYDETQPRGYVPGGVAGYGYPVEEDAPGSSTTEQMLAQASHMGETVRDAAERARSRVAGAAGDVSGGMSGLARAVRHNPLLLGLISLAAGTAVARSIRATETGDRLVHEGTDMLGQGARGMVSRVSGVASTMGEVADMVRTRVPEAASGVTDAVRRSVTSAGGQDTSTAPEARERSASARQAGRGHRQGRRDRQRSVIAQRASRELVDMAEQYPLLLGTLGLVIGAAVGAALRPTEVEDRYVGRASDAVKRRVQGTVADHLNQVAGAAEQVISSVEERRGGRAEGDRTGAVGTMGTGGPRPEGGRPGSGSSGDVDETDVVVERARDAAEAQAAVLGGMRSE